MNAFVLLVLTAAVAMNGAIIAGNVQKHMEQHPFELELIMDYDLIPGTFQWVSFHLFQ